MVLKVHHLRPAPGAKTKKTRKGRGEASKGKTAGRGGKGTRARNVVRAGFEGGQAVNISTINALYPKGGDVTVDDLVKKGAARKGYPVKVLGNGDISVKVSIAAHAFSKAATEKISAAGGSAKTL